MTNLIPESETPNKRERAKADRRDQLLRSPPACWPCAATRACDWRTWAPR